MGQQGKHGERFSARQKGRWQSLYFIWTCLALVNTAPSLKDLASSQRQPPAPTWSCCPAPRALHRGEQEHAAGHGATPQGARSGTWGDTARSRRTQRDMGRHHGERAARPGSAFCSALTSEPLPVAIPLCPGEQRWGAAQAPELTSSPNERLSWGEHTHWGLRFPAGSTFQALPRHRAAPVPSGRCWPCPAVATKGRGLLQQELSVTRDQSLARRQLDEAGWNCRPRGHASGGVRGE